MISDFLPLIVLLALVFALLLWRDRGKRRPARRAGRDILVDGSNVMHWQDNAPALATIRAVVEVLKARGFAPGVIFDANAGYLLFGRYRDDFYLAQRLGLPEAQVLVVPKGEPADRFLLQVARERGLAIVTNDRYRDWREAHPEVGQPGRLIRGGVTGGQVSLEMG